MSRLSINNLEKAQAISKLLQNFPTMISPKVDVTPETRIETFTLACTYTGAETYPVISKYEISLYYFKDTCDVYFDIGIKEVSFGDFFEKLPKEYQEIFVFDLDLFTTGGAENVNH